MRQTTKPFVREAGPLDWLKRKRRKEDKDPLLQTTEEVPLKETLPPEQDPNETSETDETIDKGATQEEDFNALMSSEAPDRQINEDMTLEDIVDQAEEGAGFLDTESFDEAIKFQQGDYVSPVQYQPVNAPAVSKLRQEREDEAKKEQQIEKPEDKEKQDEENKKPSDAVDPTILAGRSDGQVLADAKAVAIDIHNFSAKAEKDAVEAQRQVEQLLQGNEGQNLKSAIEALQPGSTKSDNPEEKSIFDKIAEDILEIFGGWNIVISEKKKQGRMYGEILHKLRRPQFRLPAWLESLSTGTTAEVINKTRKKRFEQARDSFLESKAPMSNAQKRDFNQALQRRVDKLQANQQVINRFFDQQGAVKFLKEYTHNKGLRQAMDGALMPLLVDMNAKEVLDQQEIAPEVVQQVKQNLQKTVRDFESKSKKDLELSPDQLGLFVDHYVKNRGKALQVIKSELGDQPEDKIANTLRPFIRSAQKVTETPVEEEATPQEPTAEQNQAAETVKRYLEKLNQIIEERIGKAEAAEAEQGEENTAIFNAYARITSMYFDPNFSPSLAALGYKWMEEHPEGSKQNYLIVETTREGDGEKLLTVFDPKTGAGSRAVKMIGDFVKHMAVPGLNQAMFEFEQLAGVSTSFTEQRNEQMFGEDSDGDGISDTVEMKTFETLLSEFLKANKQEVGDIEEQLNNLQQEPSGENAQQIAQSVGALLVNQTIEKALEDLKTAEVGEIKEQHDIVSKHFLKLAERIQEVAGSYEIAVSESVQTLNTLLSENDFPEIPFGRLQTQTQSIEEDQQEEEIDLKNQTINFAQDAGSLIDRMQQAVEVIRSSSSPQERFEASGEYLTALQEIYKQYQPIFKQLQEIAVDEESLKEVPKGTTATLRGFTHFAVKLEVLGRPVGYERYLQRLKDALEIVVKNTQEDVTPAAFENLNKVLDPQVVRTEKIVPGGIDVFDANSLQEHRENLIQQFAEDGISLTGEPLPGPTIVEKLTELAIKTFAETYTKLSGNLLTPEQVLQDEGMSGYLSKFDDAIKAEEPETKSEQELVALQENIEQQAEQFAKEYFEQEKVNPDDEQESAEALGENNPQDNPEQEPKNDDGTPIEPENTDTQAGTIQRTIKSRIDVDRANRLIALRKIQRAVINR